MTNIVFYLALILIDALAMIGMALTAYAAIWLHYHVTKQ